MSDLMPTNVEAEEAILGGILIDQGAISRVSEVLTPEIFAINAHQIIYRAIAALFSQGQPTDLMTVSNWLENHDQLAKAGGRLKLVQLVDHTVSAVNIDQYAALIEDKYKRRKLIEAGCKIAQLGQELAMPLEDILASAEEQILAINSNSIQEIWSVGDCMSTVLAELESGYKPGYTSGLPDLDNLIGGLVKKDLIVVAARASMGKTWFGGHLALQIAGKHQLPVVFFSAEMSKESLVKRFLASLSGINAQRLIWNNIRSNEWDESLSDAIGKLAEMPIIIDDTPGTALTPAAMRNVLRRVQAQYGKIGLVVLDYIQLLGERNAGNRAQDVGAIAGHCKAIAKDFDVPFVALAQINRGVEARNDKRPMMSDLKDSGDIEQDADLAICLYRDDYYNPESADKGQVELIVRKQRNGSLGTTKAFFNPETGNFRSIYKK
ncbi:MAG: replicative DNA helicase [Oscillatoriales cyanobacterium]|nr:MAG: replicative DNA helicase [Oscillatoriales cyanobacterium]